MKKRLLISSVLMSAVLACALGTGTYAWYQTNVSGTLGATSSQGEVSTSSQTHSFGGDASVQIKFDAGANNSKVELTDENGATQYVDANGNLYTLPTNEGTRYGTYTISAIWVGEPSAETKAALQGQSVTFVISGSEHVHLLTTANAADRDDDNEIEVTVTVGAGGTSLTVDSVASKDIYYSVSPTTKSAKEPANVTGTISAAKKA